MKKCRFEIINSIDELCKITEFLNKLKKEGSLPDKFVDPINVALEEAITNTIFYAFPKDPNQTHLIELEFTRDGDTITFEIKDNGVEFDPLNDVPTPDLSLNIEEKPIGGLGILLIKKLMDVVEYKRYKGINHLIISKKL